MLGGTRFRRTCHWLARAGPPPRACFHQEDAYEFFMDCMHQVTSRCIGCSVDVWEWTCSPLCAGAEPWWFFCILPSPHDCCQLSEELAEAARVLLAGGSIDSSTLHTTTNLQPLFSNMSSKVARVVSSAQSLLRPCNCCTTTGLLCVTDNPCFWRLIGFPVFVSLVRVPSARSFWLRRAKGPPVVPCPPCLRSP